jgi:hypothetical protein
MDSDKQWRIDNAKRLQGLQLRLRPYAEWSKDWEHDHCAASWVKFAESQGSDSQKEGYAGYEWVCRQPFADLKTGMKWTEVPV